MKVYIIGAGVVGQATGRGLSRFGHEVVFVDFNPKVVKLLEPEFESKMYSKPDGNVYFICTPEGEVEGVVGELALILKDYKNIPIVIRSTVLPGTARRLESKHDRPIVSNPEFLREAVAEYEFLNPPGVILGVDRDLFTGPSDPTYLMTGLYTPFRKSIHLTDTMTAEFTKLVINNYLACQVSFWNQIKMLGDKCGVNSQEVGMLASYCDERVSPYGARMHGKKYAGRCLPKDVDQLLALAKNLEIDHNGRVLLSAIKEINEMVGG